jgi:hypothetical protein
MSTRYDTESGSKSPEEVQRDVQQSRAEVEENLEALQERLSPGPLFEQVVDMKQQRQRFPVQSRWRGERTRPDCSWAPGWSG